MKPTRRADAFSLIELITVIMIIGILAAAVVPKFANAGVTQRVDAAAHRLVTDLNLARQTAFQTGVVQTVTISVANDRCSFSDLYDPARPEQKYAVSFAEDPYLTDIISANFSGSNKFKYDGYGVPDYGGLIVVGAGDVQRTVVVDSKTGEAYLQ